MERRLVSRVPRVVVIVVWEAQRNFSLGKFLAMTAAPDDASLENWEVLQLGPFNMREGTQVHGALRPPECLNSNDTEEDPRDCSSALPKKASLFIQRSFVGTQGSSMPSLLKSYKPRSLWFSFAAE